MVVFEAQGMQVSINALCTEEKKVQEMPGVRGKPWVTMLQSSVSFLAGHDEVGTIQNEVFLLQSFSSGSLSDGAVGRW